MASRKRYQLDLVTVMPGDSRPAAWTFAGDAVSGTEQSYHVTDGNFPTRNLWEFMVRIPKARGNASRCDRARHRTSRSGPSSPIDRSPSREPPRARPAAAGTARWPWPIRPASGASDVIRGDQRHQLPAWFTPLQGRMRLKQNVRPTKGTDGESLVILVQPDDYAAMIRLFFATKVWVLKEGITVA